MLYMMYDKTHYHNKAENLIWQNRDRRYSPHWWNGFLDHRLLSRQMSDLVVPISFRGIKLNWHIHKCFKTYLEIEYDMCLEQSGTPEDIRAQCKVAEFVRTYTQCVFIDEEDLDWPWVPNMLSHLGNFKHLM